jgi:ATP/maltotriose-dependent transcriptional regulator MalT/DNA-binding SARP family transcriptional activator
VSEFRFRSKVTCPALPAVHLSRDGLMKRLGEAVLGEDQRRTSYKLVLIHAPAGYGKTTLLADFALRSAVPCCWYVLDQTDSDGITFLTTLLMSIRQRFPDFGRELDPLLTGAASQHANELENVYYFETVVNTLIAAIEREIDGPLALILCNYQEINDLSGVNGLVSYLLSQLPARCVLLIESRVIPNLDFAPLLAGQMVCGIGVSLLRFTSSEIHRLAHLQGVEPLTDAEAENLVARFDGWIAGILLGTRLSHLRQIQGNLPVSGASDGSEGPVSSQYLFSYVINEVFKNHREVYTFLKEASILQEMSPALCAALLNIAPSQAAAYLHYLKKESLFVMHSGEGPDAIYTCTPILRTLLHEELRKEAPERFSYLHQRAASLLSDGKNYSQAIYHALEANVYDSAASLIIESAEQMMNEGHAEMLARWIDNFPATTLDRHPKLLLIRANIYLRQKNHTRALPLLDAAERAARSLANSPDPLDIDKHPTLQAEITIARSQLLFQQGEYEQSLLLCQQMLTSLPMDEVMLRADVYMRFGMCYILLGNVSEGIAQIQKALQLWGRHTVRRQTADGHSALAAAYGMLGNFALAEHHFARALACWKELEDIWGKIDHMIRFGSCKLRQGAFAEAEQAFEEALNLARGPAHFQHGEAYALASLGQLYQRRGYYERALEMTEEALALSRQISDPLLTNSTLGDLAMTYLYMGDAGTAQMLISDVKIQTTMGGPIGYKQAIRDLIYGTIYLYQRQHDQAWPYLSTSEAVLSKVGLKEEHLLALLRLASYYVAQKKLPETACQLEAAATIMSISEGYELLARQEVRHLPVLQQAIQARPELASARVFFSLEPEHPVEPLSLIQNPSSSPPAPEIMRVPHKISILALGEPVVYLDQEPVTRWRMARAMELCFYLLNCGRPMRKEAIITALWPEVDEQTTRTFYSTVYYLRQALGDESVIAAKGGSYALTLEAVYRDDIWYDVAAFEAHLATGRKARAEENDEQAKAAYLAMVNLYRGEYVQSFYSDWCTARRDELRSAYLEAHQQLALIAWRAEDLDESILHWQQMLALDNWLEEAHYGLMRCYARQGKRGLALRQYQRCKEILQQEFAAVPKASMQSLYQRLVGSL